ncbi:TPA: hypothetical protein I4G69_003782, partial [Enterobacter asburiae]|nr:hypothetical protein [Enterobacter asburiae]
MAFLTNLTSVYITTDTLNTDPKSKQFKEVSQLSEFPSFGSSTDTVAVETYNSTFQSKTTGNSSYTDMTITVNWNPEEHAYLDSIVEQQEEIQVKVEMLDEGVNDTSVNYVMYNGYLSSNSTDSDFD